jgi:hypothetical protein
MNITTVLAGLAAIPRLIDRIDQLISHAKSEEKKKWMQISARVERKLHEASIMRHQALMNCALWSVRLKILLISLSGCSMKAPSIEVCVIDAVSDIAYCELPDGSKVERGLPELNKYIAIPSDDAFDYFRYCKMK